MVNKKVEDIYPLSPMQHGMLFHTLYTPNSEVYFQQLTCDLSGNLNASAFKRAWQQVTDRHSVLRTVFIWKGLDEPRQVVHQQVVLPWQEQDWRSVSSIQQQERLQVYLQTDREKGFNLSRRPLMRFALIRLTEKDYQFVWSYHHILFDGWSLPLVLKEVFAYYEAFCQGQDLQLENPPPYRNYIAWLKQQDLSKAEAFWRQTLKGFTSSTSLVIGKTAEQEWVGEVGDRAEGQITLSTTTTTALQILTQKNRLTLNTLLQGIWALLLSRYSGDKDVVFGATGSGRPTELAGVETMVGLFINTLPVRICVSSEAPLLPWLQDLQMQQAEIRQYEYSSLAQIQNWSELPRGTPLFESILIFENYPVDNLMQRQEEGVKLGNARMFEKTNYPLVLKVGPGEELALKIVYSNRHFDSSAISRMLGHLQTQLESIAADPDQRLCDLPLLTEAEYYQLLVEWNETRTDHLQNQCIHELFEAQVEKNPSAVAVACEEDIYSYQELNRRANQLAHFLQSLGVKPDMPVGLLVERSLDIMVGQLGILKAGGAYVPIDPIYPYKRIHFMLEGARAPILLTQARLAAALPDIDGIQIVCLDTDWDMIAQHSAEFPPVAVTPSNLMYVLFTSGSTGRPKGVALEHRHYLNYLRGILKRLNISAGMSFAIVSTFAADLGTPMVFGSICTGGQLHIILYERSADPEALAEYFRRHPIDVLKIVPSHFEALQVSPSMAEIIPRQRLIFAGEACHWETIAKVRATNPGSVIQNHYGPTETAVSTLTYSAPKELPQQYAATVPLGRPLDNTWVYILDAHMQFVPIGASGELYIGGAGVTRGYINQPALTAERYVPDPFSDVPGARLYRTGDLARYLPDGNVEFLGRVDHQVKVRGYRIELGEIEAELIRHPSVQEAVVLAREDEPGDPSSPLKAGKRLVAYIVGQDGQAPMVGELRSSLQEKLPQYMVPLTFVALEALPLTPNGKVDRRALPAPDTARPELEKAFVAPRTSLEENLAEIWAETLKLDRIGIHDNFLELGGYSLLAIEIVSRVCDAFEIDLPLRSLFEAPTIAELALVITQKRAEQVDAEILEQLLSELEQSSSEETHTAQVALQPPVEEGIAND